MDSKYNIPEDSIGARRSTEKRIRGSRRAKRLSEKYNFEKAVIIGSRPDFLEDIKRIRQKFKITKVLDPKEDMITIEKPGCLFETHSKWLNERLTDEENRDIAQTISELAKKYHLGINFYESIESLVLYNVFDRIPTSNFTEHIGGEDDLHSWHVFCLNGPANLDECKKIIKSEPTFTAGLYSEDARNEFYSYQDFSYKFLEDSGVLQFRVNYFKNEDPKTIKENKKLFSELVYKISKEYFETYRPIIGIKTDAKIANYYIEIMQEKKDLENDLKTGQIAFYEDRLRNVCENIARRIWTSEASPEKIKKRTNQVKKRLSRLRKRQ